MLDVRNSPYIPFINLGFSLVYGILFFNSFLLTSHLLQRKFQYSSKHVIRIV